MPLTSDIDVDVCVLGGGIAGLTVARELARRGSSVAVLQAERESDLDRSAGLVVPGYAAPIERIIDHVGWDKAREIWGLVRDGATYVLRTAIETMPDAYVISGHLAVARSTHKRRFRNRASLLRDEFGADVEFWAAQRIREALQSERYFQALHFPNAFSLNPIAYLRELEAAAEHAGARIFENTPALSIDAEGVRKRVETKSARVRAGRIVLAGGARLGKSLPALNDTLLHLRTFSVVTVPLGERLRHVMPFQSTVAELDGEAAYHVVNGDRILWSGRATVRTVAPERMAARLRGDIARAFPQLGPVEIAHAWSASAGYAVHRMPQIGELKPGLWLADAFGRQSLSTSAMAGLLIASAIADGDDRWRLFSSYGLSWNGGWAGRALVEAALSARRARNRFRDILAPYRPVPAADAEVPTHTEAPPIVPPEEAPITPPTPRSKPEPALPETSIAAALPEPYVTAPEAAEPKPVRAKRVRRAGRKTENQKRNTRAERPAPADVIVVRKTPKRRTKLVASEPSAPPAIATDVPDSGSS